MTAKIVKFPLRGRKSPPTPRAEGQQARAEQFRQGLPVIVGHNGVRVREYPDGTLETLAGSPPQDRG